MTENDKSATGGEADFTEPPSAVNVYLVGRGLDTLEDLAEIPRKPGKQTRHDQLMRARIDGLVGIIETFAEDLLTAADKIDGHEARHIGLVKRIQAARKAVDHAAGAARVMWLLTSILRSYGGSPVVYTTEEEAATDGRAGVTYNFKFPRGVHVDYSPWRDADQMQVMCGDRATQYFSVNFNGTMPPKEEDALIGFLTRNGITAMFPLNSAPQEGRMDQRLVDALTKAGIDPTKITLHQFGDDVFVMTD